MPNFFINHAEVVVAMSERKDGTMRISANSNQNRENRERFFEKNGIQKERVVAAEIVHGARVGVVDEKSPDVVLGVDGLVTKNEKIFLSVTIADCIPVFFFETEKKIVGIAHCGWRGIVGGIVENILNEISELGGDLKKLKVAIGPGIKSCHFEIQKDVLEKFSAHQEFILERDGKIFVDLGGIIKKQLKFFGVNMENIEESGECTFEGAKYFSFRRDKPKVVEAMVAVIGVR